MDISKTLDWVRQVVDINSGTRNQAGVLEVQRHVASSLTALGFRVEWIDHPQGKAISGPLLLATKESAPQAPWATLVGHADTVFEPDHPFQKFSLAADRETATGPGIIDDKASLAVGIEACRRFAQTGRAAELNLRFLCTPTEEIGSNGWHELFHTYSRASRVSFGLEPAIDSGDFIVERKGGRWYKLEIEGKEAHAGRAHHLGINAGHELAVKIDRLQKLTDYRRGNTVNLGSFEGGGGKYNVVCGHAVGRIDVRYLSRPSGKALFAKIEKIFRTAYVGKGKKRAKARFQIEDDCPPMERRKESEPWIAFHAKQLARLEKRKSGAGFSGGGSDSSHLARPGLVVIDGLGACGGGIHTPNEFLRVSSLETRSQALADLMGFTAERLGRT